MKEKSIHLEDLPRLRDPLLIAGFEGWGNALDISRGMADYLIRKLDAKAFGRIDPDLFYRYDENRPLVEIQDGMLLKVTPPGGRLYATAPGRLDRDVVILRATEPNLRWAHFVDALLSLCEEMGIRSIVCLGSMYDNVLHTDTVISAVASSKEIMEGLRAKKVLSVDYRGPTAIHSTIHQEGTRRGLQSISLWCHCPYYLQGTTHFGLLSHLGSLLSSWGDFRLDTDELDRTWKDLNKQIQGIIEKNPELQAMINDLRKAKVKGSWDMAKKDEKVIHLEDFLKPK